MGQDASGSITPTPRYYEVRGRAAEIARAAGSPGAGAEHFFLAIVHAGAWPAQVLARFADLAAVEAAVLTAIPAPADAPPATARRSRTAGTGDLLGARTAQAMGDSYLGVEHAFLAIIADRASVPARALAAMADLDAVQAAVLEAKGAPPRVPKSAVVLPDGERVDGPLAQAMLAALPAEATFGFNTVQGRTYVQVLRDAGAPDAAETRAVVNAARAHLGRPELS